MVPLRVCPKCSTVRPLVSYKCDVRWMRDCPECNRARVKRNLATLKGVERERERGAARRQDAAYREYHSTYGSEWRKTERGRHSHAESERRRAAAKKGVQVEKIDRLAVFDAHGGICGICDLPADRSNFHLDHVVPLSKGGTHTYENVQPAHPRCNIQKGGALL